jgi:type II secretory pathway pseudopilin PulG
MSMKISIRKKYKYNDFKKGFSLLETMVAITILMTTIVGPLALASKGIVFADYVKNEITGFYLAQEAVEAIRNIRDGNIKNAGDWLEVIKQQCTDGNGNSVPCQIDIWNFNPPNYGLKKCSGDIEKCERIKTVDLGENSGAGRLYGHIFNPTILFGRQMEDSIFSRKITIKNVDYSASGVSADDLALIEEINVTVEVSWFRAATSTKRSVKVSENMFSI